MEKKIITVKNCDLWTTIESMGEYEKDYKNGELWYFGGKLYYLSHLELPFKELQELVEFYNNNFITL